MLRIESLETRDLLSVALPGYAVTDLVAFGTEGGAAPMATAGPTGYSPGQIRHAYGFDAITFSNGTIPGDGSGTTIAIVDAFDNPKFVSSSDPNFVNSDLHKFDLQFNLPDAAPFTFTKVNQTGGQTSYPRANRGWASEIALDVEWAHAIAPKANILLVEANNNSYANLFAAVDYARHVSSVVVVSMSWGGGEFAGEKGYDSLFTTPSGHVGAGGYLGGVTFLASSGDSGAPAGYPAISPNVVAVGGTTLTLNGQGNYGSERGWSGSGGGISAYEAQPLYQQGVVTQSTKFRANPDVAYDANPNTGFPVYDSYNNPLSTPWSQYGGTSVGAPQWAGLIAIADQGRALAGLGSLDGATQTLKTLYALPSSDFHDITTGSSTGHPRYSAGPGYDLVTGRGSPYANLVVNDLVTTVSTLAAPHFSTTATVGLVAPRERIYGTAAAQGADSRVVTRDGEWSAAERDALAAWFNAFESDGWGTGLARTRRAESLSADLFAQAADDFFQMLGA